MLKSVHRFFSALEKSKITSLHQKTLSSKLTTTLASKFLALAWSRAQQDNFPFLDTCNVYFNYKEIQTTPIKTHATLTKIFLIGINLHVDKNLPDIWARQSRDIDKIFSKDDIYSLWRWLLFHDTSGLNKGSGVTIMITDKIAKDLQHTEFVEGRIINLIFGFKKSNQLNVTCCYLPPSPKIDITKFKISAICVNRFIFLFFFLILLLGGCSWESSWI
ncbi:hypothetical protein GLOIN_2v1579716 [Rhizophagus irregularis DAOM 181602=DAOM 197198]|nr:hypothetical protein GLOIN_2v1579716 [Rhizophagus irregularis DAOM 181602=DAOM 197198]